MNAPDSFDQWQELLAGYVLGDLSPEDAIKVHQYLAEHPEKVAEVQQLQDSIALMALALPEASPSANLRTQLLQAAQNMPQMTATSSQTLRSSASRVRMQRWNRTSVMAGGIAASLVAALGIMNLQLRHTLTIAQQEIAQLKDERQHLVAMEQDFKPYQDAVSLLHQPNNRLLALTGSGAMASSSGSLVIVPSQRTAVLTLKNLPPLPNHQMYQLWAVVEGKKMPCPKFAPDAIGRVFIQLPVGQLTEASKVVVTVEPVESKPQPTGAMVLSGT